MAMADHAFEASPQLEAGCAPATVSPGPGEKEAAMTSPTCTQTTFQSSHTLASTLSSLKRARRRAAEMGLALLPRRDKGKLRTEVTSLEAYPLGYPRLACLLDSDDVFTMYRRFGVLHSRLLLMKQDQLRELEGELLISDCQDKDTREGRKCLRSREREDIRTQHAPSCRPKLEIFQDIEQRMLEYGQILKQAQEFNLMNKPTEHDRRSLINFIENYQLVGENDGEFVYRKEDLVSLRAGRENAWLDAAVETVLRCYPCKPLKSIFSTEDIRRKTIDPDIIYFSRSRINFVVTIIITCMILALLVGPIAALFELTQHHNVRSNDAACIGVLLVSTLVFSSILSMFTKARRHEILAAAAG